MRLYLDTAPVIYVVEQVDEYADSIDERLNQPDTVLITSQLTQLECRVKPVREANAELLRDYDEFFEEAVEEIVALSCAVIDRATHIRAHFNFKTPDAIHLAAAVEAKCEMFLTNDNTLTRFADLKVELV
ncbi:MAG: PIN domain-containing protein [Candidatus Latescibacteria bacterium]|nr:PIN domain-containing protein [Candidatus Latescibacterota bacterium]